VALVLTRAHDGERRNWEGVSDDHYGCHQIKLLEASCAGRMPERGIISVWRVVAPPGYGALGDVVSVGLDPPTAPVQVCPALPYCLASPQGLCRQLVSVV
jgi:hypothetical protein